MHSSYEGITETTIRLLWCLYKVHVYIVALLRYIIMYMYYILFISVVSSIPVVLVILDCSCWPPFLPGKRTRARLALYFENNWKMHQSFHKERNRYNLMYTVFITLNLQLCSALFCRICFNYDKRFYSFTWLRFEKGIFKP